MAGLRATFLFPLLVFGSLWTRNYELFPIMILQSIVLTWHCNSFHWRYPFITISTCLFVNYKWWYGEICKVNTRTTQWLVLSPCWNFPDQKFHDQKGIWCQWQTYNCAINGHLTSFRTKRLLTLKYILEREGEKLI